MQREGRTTILLQSPYNKFSKESRQGFMHMHNYLRLDLALDNLMATNLMHTTVIEQGVFTVFCAFILFYSSVAMF